jgi:RNA polymerase primary sigma factor
VYEDELRRYLDAAANARPLVPGDEAALFQAMAEGDAASEQRLIDANRPLVVSLARSYYKEDGPPMTALVDAGHRGLLNAVRRFDRTKEFKFSTWATWWIRQSMTRSIAEWG